MVIIADEFFTGIPNMHSIRGSKPRIPDNYLKALDQVLEGVNDEKLLGLAGDRPTAEGLFLPESYRYERGDSDWDILQRAHAALNETLAQSWQGREDNLPYESPYEALIMASIVERETGVPEERAEIAGVFVRRMRRGMRLQTDPTIIYGLGESFDGDIRYRDLRRDTPYNTYLHHGLTPTPIALPGADAIHAALHPADSDAIYFVSKGDGTHHFSTTLEEHNAAVSKYQLKGRKPNRPAEPG